jgi:hypothetical protein
MTTERARVLAVAVAYGKLGYVLLIDGVLKDWHCSREASLEATRGRSFLRKVIARLEPDLVVIEDPHGRTRKFGTSREVLLALAQELTDSATPHQRVSRKQGFANKYVEAEALTKQFPEIAPWLPHTPRIWESEPTNTIYFEALSMAVTALE